MFSFFFKTTTHKAQLNRICFGPPEKNNNNARKTSSLHSVFLETTTTLVVPGGPKKLALSERATLDCY